MFSGPKTPIWIEFQQLICNESKRNLLEAQDSRFPLANCSSNVKIFREHNFLKLIINITDRLSLSIMLNHDRRFKVWDYFENQNNTKIKELLGCSNTWIPALKISVERIVSVIKPRFHTLLMRWWLILWLILGTNNTFTLSNLKQIKNKQLQSLKKLVVIFSNIFSRIPGFCRLLF